MYERITGESGYAQPMRIYPAPHYTMGGLWVDYNLMSNLPGLFVLGEANFSDHGANRLGASALMQGLADGYFIIPYTIGDYFASNDKILGQGHRPGTSHAEFKQAEGEVAERTQRLLTSRGKRTPTEIHREVGRLVWDKCGMARNEQGLKDLLARLPEYRDRFHSDVIVPGSGEELNMSLERAGRVADFIEFAEMLALDALTRAESCGGHFREESQYTDADVAADPTGKTMKGEAKRDDTQFQHVSAWEYQGVGREPVLHKEPLAFTEVKPAVRSYQ